MYAIATPPRRIPAFALIAAEPFPPRDLNVIVEKLRQG
jgi:hypothetical protein